MATDSSLLGALTFREKLELERFHHLQLALCVGPRTSGFIRGDADLQGVGTLSGPAEIGLVS